jgi:hypothetical protein
MVDPDDDFTPEELEELERLAEGARGLAAAGFSWESTVRRKECLLPEDFSWMEEAGLTPPDTEESASES